MAEPIIALEAQTVFDLFNEVLGVYQPMRPDLDTRSTRHVQELEDQFARFRIFTNNVGVFAKGHASLDWRLRSSEDASTLTRQLLRSLQWFLQLTKHSPGVDAIQANDNKCLTPEDDGAVQGLSTSVESSVSSSETSLLSETTQDTAQTAASSEHLTGIEATVDRLLRLSWLIRKPVGSYQSVRAATAREDKAGPFRMTNEDGSDYEAAFLAYAASVVQHRCPLTEQYLIDRMASSMTMRRKRFLYRKHHQDKLSFELPELRPGLPHKDLHKTPTPSVIARAQTGNTRLDDWPSQQPPTQRMAKEYSETSASGFSRTQFNRQVVMRPKSVVSTRILSPVDHAEDFEPPPPPRVHQGAKEVECPYCYVVIPSTKASEDQWKHHFLEDLEPFVCVVSECAEPTLFGDFSAWVEHLQSAHGRQWCCSAPGHEKLFYDTAVAYEAHMWQRHPGAFSASQLPMLRKRAQKLAMPITSCPFCDDFGPLTALEDVGHYSRDLVAHVAGHLRSLAMISLPVEELVNGEVGQKEESHRAVESNEGEHDSWIGDWASQTVKSSVSDLGGVSSELSVSVRFDDIGSRSKDDVAASTLRDEWGFLDAAGDYPGLDRDPILQTFLRKRYLESSPTMTEMRGPLLPCRLVPFTRNSDFFARGSALANAEATLLSSVIASQPSLTKIKNPKTFVVHGAGGMGKTQLALEFVHRHCMEFDAVFWAQADDRSKLAKDFNTIARKLGLVAEDSADATDFAHTRELVKRWLVDPLTNLRDIDSDRACWLLVFDAVDDPRILSEFWPYDGPGSIIITSRNAHGWDTSLSLPPFSTEEAADYLLNLTGRWEGAEGRMHVENISRRLGGHPLALTQMAGIITSKSMTFAQFAKDYEEREGRQRLFQTAPTSPLRTPWYDHSVASAWPLENLRDGLSLLNTCSMFDPDGISERLYTDNFGMAILYGLPRSPAEYQRAKTELLSSSIISSEKGSGKLRIHRLVQEMVRSNLQPIELREAFMAALGLVSRLWPFEDFSWRHGTQRWLVCEELFPHVSRLKDTANQYQLFPSTSDGEGDFAFARLLTDAGWYHHERGRSAEAESFNDLAERICSTWVKIDEGRVATPWSSARIRKLNATLAEITHNRGCIAAETNQPNLAFRHLQAFHAVMVSDFASSPDLVKSDMRLAISWNELGNAHMLTKHWQKGEECFKQSVETMSLLQDFDVSTLSLPLVNLGLAHWLQGRYSKALGILQQGLRDREQTLGVEDRSSFITGRYLHALGNVTGSMGKLAESLDYHRRALFYYKSTLGNGHHRTADLFVKVADHSIRLTQYDNSIALLDHAFRIYDDRSAGGGSEVTYLPEKARAVFMRSRALRSAGKLSEADAEMDRAASLHAQVTGASERYMTGTLTYRNFDEPVAFWSK